MKSAGKARSNGLYRHIRTSKEIIRNLLNDYYKHYIKGSSSRMAWNDVVSTIAQRDPYRPVSSKTFIACVFGVQ